MKKSVLAAIAGAIVWLNAPAYGATTLHIDAATVQKSGTGPQAVVLLPGLGGGPFVFDAVRDELAQRFTVYSVSFAGFDGNPAVKPPYLDAFTASVRELIDREHLVKPLLVGHSLGGHVALHVAELEPDAIGGILAIDALPLFPPPQPGETPQARHAQVTAFSQMMQQLPDPEYAAAARRNDAQLVTSPGDVETVTEHALRSDRATFVGSAAEMMLEDLRPGLGSIAAPVTVLVPVPSAPASDGFVQAYEQFYAGTKRLTVTPVTESKHFIMFDQPQRFRAALDAFVGAAVADR